MSAFSKSFLAQSKNRTTQTRNIIRIRFSLIKARFFIVRVIKKILLGPIAGGVPLTVIRSLDESSCNESFSNHIVEKKRVYNETFQYYKFPESYPPQFRRYKSFERRSVFLLKEVVASPLTGAIWLPEGPILQESVGSIYRLMGWGNTLRDIFLPVTETNIEGEIICCPPTGYYHWLLEVMPNLANAIEKYPDAKVLLHAESPAYIKEALAILLGDGFASRLIESDTPVRATRIAMTQFEAYSGFVRFEDIEKLRKVFLSQNKSLDNQPARFYVSRSRTSKRKIGNEKEIERALLGEGFEIAYLEEMTFGQQIALFSHADAIIAPHGAGLANLVWAKSHSRVLEVFPHQFFNDCYARLSTSRSLNYDYIACQPDANSHGAADISQIISWLIS